MAPVLVALAWAPFSFLLHNIIHEGAHALVARLQGARITAFWPFPGTKLGYFTFAHIKWEGTLNPKQMSRVLVAPVVAEIFWMVAALVGFALTDGWLRMVLLVEVISSNVDIANWWFQGFYIVGKRPNCDATRFAELTGLNPNVGRIWTVPHWILWFVLGIYFQRVFGF